MTQDRSLFTGRAGVLRLGAVLLMGFFFVLGGAGSALSALDYRTGGGYEELQVLKGDIETIRTSGLKRVSITDPGIADINDARAKAVEIIGVSPGQTILFIWEDTGKRTVVIRVVTENLDFVQKRIEHLLESAGIRGLALNQNSFEGKIVVTGYVTEEKATALQSILGTFGDQIINMTEKEKVEDLIQIDAQVTELDTTLTKIMGIDWFTGESGTLLRSYKEDLPSTQIPHQNGTFKDLFKIGKFSQTEALTAQINALISEGKGKILSKPRVVVVSGKEAAFMVGGQIPILTSLRSADGITSTTTYKDYGITLNVTPTIQGSKMVSLLLNVSISDIDTSDIKGNSAGVAFKTRSAQTYLLLDDQQPIVLAGLIKHQESTNVNRVPVLSKIPIVGPFFRNKNLTPNKDTEVVIQIKPTILRNSTKSVDQQQVPEEKTGTTPEFLPPTPDVVPVISKAPEVSVAGSDPEAYAAGVQQKILSAIAYPYEAQEKGWQGTVKLVLVVQKDGTLSSVLVKESSGYEVFDQDAVNTAQILAPYAAFPPGVGADEMTLTVPIVYSLDGFLQNVSSE